MVQLPAGRHVSGPEGAPHLGVHPGVPHHAGGEAGREGGCSVFIIIIIIIIDYMIIIALIDFMHP